MINLTTNPFAWVALALALISVALSIAAVRMSFANRLRRGRRLSAEELAIVRRFGLDAPERSDG